MNNSRLEVFKLYREIIRTSRQFAYWQSPQGEPWSIVLIRSARKEMEQARFERDPTVIARLIFVGYDCLNKTKDKFKEAVLKGSNSGSR